MTRLVGLDLSLTSTGIARLTLDDTGDARGSHTQVVMSDALDDPSLAGRIRRVDYLTERVVDLIAPESADPRGPALVVVEGASFGSTGGQADERAWLRGNVYRELWACAVPLVEVAPKTLKLYGAGDGNASKATVVQAVRRHYGDRFDIPLRKADGREDIADAIVLVAMAARSVGHPIDLDHPTRERAMRSPRWTNREDT